MKYWTNLFVIVSVLISMSGFCTVIRGPGAQSCGKWSKDRKFDLNSTIVVSREAWVLGYLSGVNILAIKKDILKNPDVDGIIGWIDRYCIKNPIKEVADAADALVDELNK